jgi:hypothetical protein
MPTAVQISSVAAQMKKFSFIPEISVPARRIAFARTKFNEILDSFIGLGRGPGYQSFVDGNVLLYSLAEMLARRVAGRHNKNAIFILFGDLGGGKSMTLLKLAVSCAQWIAAIRGGKPSDYFTFKHVAIIDPEMLQEQLANLKQYGVYLLDDAGPGYDARTFMSKSNRDLNYILQTCRTSNNIILVSAPHGAMLDVTIHRVAQYYAEVSEVRHEIGLTFLKVFRLIRVFREGKIFYVYMTKRGVSVKRYYATLPIPEMKVTYDKVREAMAKKIQEKKKKREEEEAANRGRGGRHDQFRITKEMAELAREECLNNPVIESQELAAIINCTVPTLQKVLLSGSIKKVKGDKNKKWDVKKDWKFAEGGGNVQS